MATQSWIIDGFINKNLYAPFVIETDYEFYGDLKKRYDCLKKTAIQANADEESKRIIYEYTSEVLSAIREYYHGRITSSQRIIYRLIEECIAWNKASSPLNRCEAFGHYQKGEIQFFRARIASATASFKARDMLHLPVNLRSKARNERFSLSGIPGFYLSNSSYGCWLELNRPNESSFWVSPCLLDGELRVLNLAVMNRDMRVLNDFDEECVHYWLRLLILMIATSYRIEEGNRHFFSEYIIPQNIMLACKDLGLDGVVYYSNKVSDHLFAQFAINIALFVDYETIHSKESQISKHTKIGTPKNFQFYKHLIIKPEMTEYDLRSLHTPLYKVTGDYDDYTIFENLDFCTFDKYLFANWAKKDEATYGVF